MAAKRTGGKVPLSLAGDLGAEVRQVLDLVQSELFRAAKDRREAATRRGVSKAELIEMMAGPGGFAYAGYCGDAACETAIKEETKATVRVLPDEEFRSASAPATCVWCGRPSVTEAVWAKAY
jgi:prolyl-tRNA synthetase